MVEKHEWRRIHGEIRHVLLEVWDPIGVKDVPQAQDEYDCCLGGIFRLLTTGGTDDEIADYLWKQASEHMGLGLSPSAKEQMYSTVVALRRINISK